MTVKELITELKKCNPDAIVMFNNANTIKNMGYFTDGTLEPEVLHLPIDEVNLGAWTGDRFVFLSEELL